MSILIIRLTSKAIHIAFLLVVLEFANLLSIVVSSCNDDPWIVGIVITVVMNIITFLLSCVVIFAPLALGLAKLREHRSVPAVVACLLGNGLLYAFIGLVLWDANEHSFLVSSGLGFSAGIIYAVRQIYGSQPL
jgi:hypothetical protein